MADAREQRFSVGIDKHGEWWCAKCGTLGTGPCEHFPANFNMAQGCRPEGVEGVAAPGPTPQDETGWLIEKGQLCLGSCDRKPAWVTFTDPSAVRFARKVDAENMLNSLRSMSDKGAFEECTISDHMWVGA